VFFGISLLFAVLVSGMVLFDRLVFLSGEGLLVVNGGEDLLVFILR
jgi:hypothetical protein